LWGRAPALLVRFSSTFTVRADVGVGVGGVAERDGDVPVHGCRVFAAPGKLIPRRRESAVVMACEICHRDGRHGLACPRFRTPMVADAGCDVFVRRIQAGSLRRSRRFVLPCVLRRYCSSAGGYEQSGRRIAVCASSRAVPRPQRDRRPLFRNLEALSGAKLRRLGHLPHNGQALCRAVEVTVPRSLLNNSRVGARVWVAGSSEWWDAGF